jgi:hypothetical protein
MSAIPGGFLIFFLEMNDHLIRHISNRVSYHERLELAPGPDICNMEFAALAQEQLDFAAIAYDSRRLRV